MFMQGPDMSAESELMTIENELMQMFILKDYLATHNWLPINPKRQAIEEYHLNPAVQQRVNSLVGDILEVIERGKTK